jgi:hypothetical protein
MGEAEACTALTASSPPAAFPTGRELDRSPFAHSIGYLVGKNQLPSNISIQVP